MKIKLLALTAAGVFAGASVVLAQGPMHAMHGKHHHGGHLDELTTTLNLTAEQKMQVQPIIDQAKPQIAAIHKEAMEKTHAVMESTTAQVRPLLTADQQQKLDALKKAHEDMRKAMRDLHEAKKK